MEREGNYRGDIQPNAVNFFPANPPAVNMTEMMRQTHFGHYPPTWEVYRDTVGHDGIRRLERYTPDRKIGAVEQVNGWSRFIERDYRGEDPRSGEGYLETDRRKNYYTKVGDLLVVWRDSYGNPIHSMGNRELMSEYSASSDDLLKRHEANLRQQEIIRQREARRQEFLRQQAIRAHQNAVRRNQEAIRQYQTRLAYHQAWLRGQQVYSGPMPYENPNQQPFQPRSQEVPYQRQQYQQPRPSNMPIPRSNTPQLEQYRYPQPPVGTGQVAFQENQRRQEPVEPRPPHMPTPRSAAVQMEQYRYVPNPEAPVRPQGFSPEEQGVEPAQVQQPANTDAPAQEQSKRSVRDVLDENAQKLKLGLMAGAGAVGVKASQGRGALRRFRDNLDKSFILLDPNMTPGLSTSERVKAVRSANINRDIVGKSDNQVDWRKIQIGKSKASLSKYSHKTKKAEEVSVEKTKSGAGRARRGARKAGEVTYNAVGAVVLGTAAAGALAVEGGKRLTASNQEAARKMSVPVLNYIHEKDKEVDARERKPYTQYKKSEFKYSEWDNTAWEGAEIKAVNNKRSQKISKNNNKYILKYSGEIGVDSLRVNKDMQHELGSNWVSTENLAEKVDSENTSFMTNFIRKIVMRNKKGQYVNHEDGLTRKEREEMYRRFS